MGDMIVNVTDSSTCSAGFYAPPHRLRKHRRIAGTPGAADKYEGRRHDQSKK
jgi:hypothetical protein